MRAALAPVRRVVGGLFYRFGIHCATHQIRVILICAVVITSLFYPALAVYTSTSLKPFSSLLVPWWRSADNALADLQEPWHACGADQQLRVIDDYDSRLRCGLDATVRVERVTLRNIQPKSRQDGALDTATLQAALQLEQRINELLLREGAPQCVEGTSGCFVLSPLHFWYHDAEAIARDTNPVATINAGRKHNVSVDGFPLTPETVLASLTPTIHGDGKDIAQAEMLVTTYFFQDSACDSPDGHAAWVDLLHEAVGKSGHVHAWPQQPVLLPLQYHTTLTRPSRLSVISAFLYLTYIAVFFNFSGSMRSVNTVHSRFGLALTGLVEILASTITSVSVLALWGFRITLVPWGILPLIIVFVGAENMFFMVNAVVKTNVTMPVKERIAEGVSQAGTSNTLKAVTYNSVLGTIAFFAHGAIRQFCVFAIVVLVAHWFLIHTLFLTVLSIDLQRLELSEVLRQDPGLSPSSSTNKRSASAVRGQGQSVQKLVRSRATKDGSLLLILAVTVIMYYVTYPSPDAQAEAELDPFARQSLRTPTPEAAALAMTPALRLWQTLNPLGKKLVHLRVEPPSLVQFSEHAAARATAWTAQQLLGMSSRRTRALLWALKIVLLPIAGTCGVLYALLIQLLKNTELLETQRARSEGYHSDGQSADEGEPARCAAAFGTLPRAFASDAEMVAVAKSAGVCAAVSVDNVLAVWAEGGRPCVVVDVCETLGVVACVAIDAAGSRVAVGTTTGALGVWAIDLPRGAASEVQILALENVHSPVLELAFIRHEERWGGGVSVVATHENGVVAEWALDTERPLASFVQPTAHAITTVRTVLVHERERDAVGVAFVLDTGAVEVLDCLKGPGGWVSTCCIQAGPFHDSVIQLDRMRVSVGEAAPRVVVATLSRLGALRLWDAQTSELILHVDSINSRSACEWGSLRAAALAPEDTACERCREQAAGGFVLATAVGETVFVYRGLVAERCACALAGGAGKVVGVGRRSRAGSTVPPPLRSRLPHRVPSDFPISGHGFHSRRSSEKEYRRAALAPEEDTPEGAFASASAAASTESATPGRWKELTVRCVADVPCERGSWSIVGTRVVGVRRRARGVPASSPARPAPPLPGDASGFSAAVLQRWEAWSVDVCQLTPSLHSSTLYSLFGAPLPAPKPPSPARSRVVSRQPSMSSLPAPPSRRPSNPSLAPPPVPSQSQSHSQSQHQHQRQPSVTSLVAQLQQVAADSRYPRLPFTRASILRAAQNRCFLALGNTVCVLEFAGRLPAPNSDSSASL